MRVHFKTDTTSFANSLLMLVMFTGVLNIDLLACDAVSDYDDDRVLHRMELVLSAGKCDTILVFSSVSENTPPGNDVVDSSVLTSYFQASCSGPALFIIQNTGKVNTQPFCSSHNHTVLFNIPHQNSGEDEAFMLHADVA